MSPRRVLTTVAVTVALVSTTLAATAANPWEQTDIVGQGPGGPIVADDGAEIRRSANGITAKVSLPTPEPGTYDYPEGPTASGVPGHPETFSLWLFLFFNPDACDGDCDGADLQSNPEVIAGAFNVGGHVAGGPNLTVSGKVNQQSTLFGGDDAESITEALAHGYTTADAEVHLAVAPHGALDPDLLPEALTTPVGDPTFWWIAVYK